MESFRVRHSDPGRERVLLLPLSFGACSTALLYILSEHLKGQVERTGRTGFKLHVLHVDDETLADGVSIQYLLEKVKQRFPEHTYALSSLSDIALSDAMKSLFQNQDHTAGSDQKVATEAQMSLGDMLSSTTGATSRADLLQILRRRFIVQYANAQACESILWADSTTRLAERTLAETAKGRGFSLPSLVADGDASHGIQFFFPMRELLSKEISSYVSMVEPPLDALIVHNGSKPTVSTKNTSVDDLMRQYFESVERNYPSVVANVVKTTGKLRAPDLMAMMEHCELCDMPLQTGAPERSRLCYGCIRTLPSAEVG